MHACMHTYTCTCTYTYTCTYKYRCTHKYTCTYTYTFTFTHTYICTRTYTHTSTCRSYTDDTNTYTIHSLNTENTYAIRGFDSHQVWDSWGTQMNTFWNSHCVPPWDCWSIGDFACMLCTPSQNTQERWHRQILDSRIPGMFKGSTEHVLKVALPQLIKLDGIFIPDELNFEATTLPRKMVEKALWYVERKATHVRIFEFEEGEGEGEGGPRG